MIDPHEYAIVESELDRICYADELASRSLPLPEDGDLVRHFCEIGWRNNLDPTRWFSVARYLGMAPDVAEAGINPFYHYLVAGTAEGRQLETPDFSATELIDTLKQLRSVHEEERSWLKPIESLPKLLSQYQVDQFLLQGRETHGNGVVVSLSHDNYLLSPGGVQVCIKTEQVLIAEMEYLYIHLYPWNPRPRLAPIAETVSVVGLTLNGVSLGYATLSTIFRSLKARASSDIKLVIHSLLGFNPEYLSILAGKLKTYYWVHDYFSFCESWILMRNKVLHCNSPGYSSQMCSMCNYGESRSLHLERMQRFLNATSPTLVFPSNDASERYETFRQRTSVKELTHVVIPHLQCAIADDSIRDLSGGIKVAFLGAPVVHKGWGEFNRLFSNRALSPYVSFYHFGTSETVLGHGLRFIRVNTSSDGPDAMADAIRKEGIDFCFTWSLWPETFGLTAVEALAGNSRVLYRKGSGAVEHNMQMLGYSDGFSTIKDVIDFLATICSDPGAGGNVFRFPKKVVIKRSRVSAELIRNSAAV